MRPRFTQIFWQAALIALFASRAAGYPLGWSNDRLVGSSGDITAAPLMDLEGNIHLFWGDSLSVGAVFYKKIGRAGTPLIEQRTIASPQGLSGIATAIDPAGYLYALWTAGSEIFFTKFAPDGSAIVPPRWIISGACPTTPQATVDSLGEIYLVWSDCGAAFLEIFYLKLDALGNPVGAPTMISAMAGHSYAPALVRDQSGFLHVVWETLEGIISEIYFAKIDDRGSVFLPARRITVEDGRSSFEPAISLDGMSIAVVWTDRRDAVNIRQAEIYYQRFDLDGGIIVGETRVTRGADERRAPQVKIKANGRIAVVWANKYSGEGANSEIAYTEFSPGDDLPRAFSRLTLDPAASELPRLVLDQRDLAHVIWIDQRSERPGMYYKEELELPCIEGNVNTALGASEKVLYVNVGGREMSVTGVSESYNPEIEIDSADLSHLVWTEGSGIYYQILRRDGTSPLSGPVRVSDGGGFSPDDATLAIGNGNANFPSANIVWTAVGAGTVQIYAAKYIGDTPSFSLRVSEVSGHSSDPAIALSTEDSMGIVWHNYDPGSGTAGVYFRLIGFTGAPRTPPVLVSRVPIAYRSEPSIAYDPSGNRFFVAWTERTTSAASRVMGALISNGIVNVGRVTMGPAQLSGRGAIARSPSIGTLQSGAVPYLSAAWVDEADGAIYYDQFLITRLRFLSIFSGGQQIPAGGVRAERPQIRHEKERSRAHLLFASFVGYGAYRGYYTGLDTANGAPLFGPAQVWLIGNASSGEAMSIGVASDGVPRFAWESDRRAIRNVYYHADVYTAGDPLSGEVVAYAGNPLEVYLANPPAQSGGVSEMAVYGWLGAPSGATMRAQPQHLGVMCLPTPLDRGAVPQPRFIWNNISASTAILGTPTFQSSPAPALLGVTQAIPLSRRGETFTLQGIIQDQNSSSGLGYSITNAVVLRVE